MTCKDCENRSPTCHIDCQDYAEQCKKSEAIREARRQAQAAVYPDIMRSIKKADNVRSIKKRRARY